MLNIVVMQNIDNRKQLIFEIIRDDFFLWQRRDKSTEKKTENYDHVKYRCRKNTI